MRRFSATILLLSFATASCAGNHAPQSANAHGVATTASAHRAIAHGATHQVQKPHRNAAPTSALSCEGLEEEVRHAMSLVKAGSYQSALDLATKAQNDASKPNPCKDDDYAEGNARLAELDLLQSYADAKLGHNDDAMAKYEIAEGDASGCYESPALHDSAVIERCRQLHDTLEQNHDATMITLGNIPNALAP